MTKENKNVFDVQLIRELVELMKENDIFKVDIEQGATRVRLHRGSPERAVSVSTFVPPVADTKPAAVAATPAVPAPVAEDDSFIKTIDSPMVGTFYSASNPDSPPFVNVGDTVGPEKTVCMIEAMKVFNEIQAEMSGKIVAVLVKNGESVDFGKPLFKVDTRQ